MDFPIAYFITFTTYGTWLHGDKRGSVDDTHNQYGSEFLPVDSIINHKEETILNNPPLILEQFQREAVLQAILEVCKFRGWIAYAVHVRSNHVHIVVGGRQTPEKILADFKAYATRALKTFDEKPHENPLTDVRGSVTGNVKYWTHHGSTRYLWTKESVVAAIDYVKNEQGGVTAFGTVLRI
jgi:REP element-mobilizing transposase RayT